MRAATLRRTDGNARASGRALPRRPAAKHAETSCTPRRAAAGALTEVVAGGIHRTLRALQT
eukprot:6328703-Alexandrium_andersonii.AAC.1